MRIVSRCLASIGIGGIRLTISGIQSSYSRGEVIHGRVRMAAGRIREIIRGVRVQLAAQDACFGGRPASAVMAAGPGVVEPGMDPAYHFDLMVPENANVGGGLGSIWRLQAVALPVGTIILPRAEVPVTIVPHREVIALQRGMQLLGFGSGLPSHGLADVQQTTGPVANSYHDAPFSLRDQVVGAALYVTVLDDFLVGNIAFRGRTTCWPVGLPSAKPAVDCTFGFQITRRGLTTLAGAPDPQAALPMLRDILRRAVILPDNVNGRTLLRASVAPRTTNFSGR